MLLIIIVLCHHNITFLSPDDQPCIFSAALMDDGQLLDHAQNVFIWQLIPSECN